MGEPAGTGCMDADIWGSHLWNENLCAVSERKSGIYAKRRYRLCDPAVSGGKGSSRRETFDSLSGENPRDFMVDTKKEAEWKMTEEGIQVVIPQEYREGETPIAIVWKIEQ